MYRFGSFSPLVSTLTLALLVLTVSGCDLERSPQQEAAVTTDHQAIVGGKKEEGWPGVGALTRNMTAYGYMGSFCSGTLIAPRWVLTAAHCLSGQPSEPLFPENVRFFVGPDANPSWFDGKLPEGRFYQADAFFIHPNYKPNSMGVTNDIALMHLAEPADDVMPYPINTTPLDKSFLNQEVLYVGYGVNNGIKQSGGGIKRSGYMTLYYYEETTYVSGFEVAGVCFGDSGGPGLMELDGEWQVIGVNSSVWSENEDPCTGAAFQTRVDAYLPWLDKVMTQQEPDCRKDDTLCWCPQACGAAGQCNNDYCTTLRCDEVRDCFQECEQEPQCQSLCYARASAQGKEELHDFYWCRMQKCYNASDLDNCALNYCSEYLDACSARPAGTQECNAIFGCVAHCDWSDPYCWTDCLAGGTLEAQDTYGGLWQCFEEACGQLPAVGFQPDCGWESCAMDIETCLPATNCSLLGGECSDGMACWYSPTNKTDCFASDGAGLDEPCAMVPLDTRPCADGLQCVVAGSGTVCRQLCATDSQCGNGEVCVPTDVEGITDFGYCDCVDADGDGTCSLDDCDDTNPDIHPRKGERCWDDIDNNCNGEIDEGCYADGEEPGVEGHLSTEQSGCQATPHPATGALILLLAALLLLSVRRSAPQRRRGR